jgi:hypothetical protein
MAAHQHALALPILRQLKTEIDRRNLEEWDPDLAARVLAMLYESLKEAGVSREEMGDVYSRLCVADPLLALKLGERS